MGIAERLFESALPVEFLLLFVVAALSAAVVSIGIFVGAQQERRERGRREHSGF